MADLQLTNCSTESDLGQLAQAVINSVAIQRDALLAQIAALSTEDAQGGLDDANTRYDIGIAPADNDTISESIGLPSQDPSQLEEEGRLEPLGLVLVRGILYSRGNDTNIENFRRLFFAVGSNVSLFLSTVRSSDPVVVIQTLLAVKKLPATQTWTLDQARTALSNDAIEAVYQMADGAFYCVFPSFLGINKSRAQVAQEFNVPIEQVVSQVFWLRTVDTSANLINRLVDYGVDQDELSAILTDQPVSVVRPSAVESLRVEFEASVRRTLDQIEFLNSRWSQSAPAAIESLRQEIRLSLNISKTLLFQLQKKVRFNPTLLERPEDIESFLELNPPEDLSYLFAQKRSVLSIDFQVTREALLERVRLASNIPAGSNTVSSVFSNTTTSSNLDIDQTNLALAANACGINGVSRVGALRWNDLQTSYQCVASIKIRPTVKEISNIPVIGYPSFDSPASTIFRRANLSLSFKIDNLFEKIIALADPISKPIAAAVRVFIAMIKSIRAATDSLLNPLIAKVSAITSQIESFLSRHASYFGTATVDSSILRCALDLNLRPDIPFLRDLEPFLEVLKKKLKNLLAIISNIVANFLSKILCLVPNFLNDLLKGATSFLPSFCKTDTFQLPTELQAALFELKQFYIVESTAFANFSRNLFTLQASVNSVPAKVTAFKDDLICNQTPLNSRFMTAFRQDLNVSLGTSPLGPITKLIPIRG